MTRLPPLAAAAILLSSCAGGPPAPVVPDAIGAEPISGFSASCEKPFVLERDCSRWSGATRKVVIQGTEILVAGSADGRHVLVMSPDLGGLARGGRELVALRTNERYELTKALLSSHGINVLRTIPMVSSGVALGYFLELDADGYAIVSSGDGEPADPAVAVDASGTYLHPNYRDVDGVAAYVHYTPDLSPIRVAISRPRDAAADGSTTRAREAAISGMRRWQEALEPEFPWFVLEFVERDPGAAIQIEWKRRMPGSAMGRGGIRLELIDGEVSVRSKITATTRPFAPYSNQALTLDEIEMLFAHEFGHALGLLHCLECDSAMSYLWETQKRILVTEMDRRTFAALVALPNGQRVDGKRMHHLR